MESNFPKAKNYKRSQKFLILAFVILLLVLVFICKFLPDFYIRADQTGYLSFSLLSKRIADYGVDAPYLKFSPISLDIIKDIIRDRDPDDINIDNRIEEIINKLKTPLATLEPKATISPLPPTPIPPTSIPPTPIPPTPRVVNPTQTSHPSNSPKCGNGKSDSNEDCDDGNTINGDGCSSKCTSEICGNNVVDFGEQCDPPNGITCNASCHTIPIVCGNNLIQSGEQCDPPNGTTCNSSCQYIPIVCGNNLVQPGEQCDPPNGTTCNASCQDIPIVCGNNLVQPGEQCDDGNTTNGDGCSASCTTEVCGNSVVDFGEQCDPPDGTTCNASCQDIPIVCGNSIIQPGEQCDPPNGTTCSATCQDIPIVCGNNIIQPGEQCDDGNTTNGDGCSNVCIIESQTVCTDVSFNSFTPSGKWLHWTISNASSQPIIISEIIIDWPITRERLYKIELEGKSIWNGSDTIPPTIVTSGWTGTVSDRTINAGLTKQLKFEFDEATGNVGITLAIPFDIGCYIYDLQ